MKLKKDIFRCQRILINNWKWLSSFLLYTIIPDLQQIPMKRFSTIFCDKILSYSMCQVNILILEKCFFKIAFRHLDRYL